MRGYDSKSVLGLAAVRSPRFRDFVGAYERHLVQTGYAPQVARFHLHAVAHFGIWIERAQCRLTTIDDQLLGVFERHRATCTCPGTSRDRARQVLSCVRRFVEKPDIFILGLHGVLTECASAVHFCTAVRHRNAGIIRRPDRAIVLPDQHRTAVSAGRPRRAGLGVA